MCVQPVAQSSRVGAITSNPWDHNMIVDSRVIISTFPPTTFRVVVSVINSTYHIQNVLIKKITTTIIPRGPQTMELGTSLAVKWSSHLTLAALLNGKLG